MSDKKSRYRIEKELKCRDLHTGETLLHDLADRLTKFAKAGDYTAASFILERVQELGEPRSKS